MSILLECRLSINKYIQEISSLSEDVACPCCGRRLQHHARYERSVIWKKRMRHIPVLRKRCPRCDKTFSLLPHFVTSGIRFANHIREFLGRYLLRGDSLSRLPERLSSTVVSILSIRTLRRWKAMLKKRWETWWSEQQKTIASMPEWEDLLLELYRNDLSEEQERNVFISLFLHRTGNALRTGAVISTFNLLLLPTERW